MTTTETINMVCSRLGVTKAELAKRMGMLPSSFYRKLARESMTLEEFRKCLEVLGVNIEFELQYPDGTSNHSRENYELLLERSDMLQTEMEAARKAAEFHKRLLRDLRTEMNSAAGYAELGRLQQNKSEEYFQKIGLVISNMECAIASALGEPVAEDTSDEEIPDCELLKGQRVLVVDDNQLNREMMNEILTAHDLVVEEARNGREAIEQVKKKEPGYYQFVLMDLEMPLLDGYEATAGIRTLPNRVRANVPIIALTADIDPESREKAIQAGMDDFLTKPINSTRLLSCLAKLQ